MGRIWTRCCTAHKGRILAYLWAGAVSAVSGTCFDEAVVLLQRSTIQLAGWVKGSQASKLGCWG